MQYEVAERFKSIQGEGCFAGTPMAFIRFVGCSVGKKICQHCDTDFERTMPWRGGGSYSERDLLLWAYPYKHVCLTGGEPLDQDLAPLLKDNEYVDAFHIETSGTKGWEYLLGFRERLWVCVSPKPGFAEYRVMDADEVKVIVPGLGSGEGWPVLQDALRWAASGKIVFLQPRNDKLEVNKTNLMYVQDILAENPSLRLSVQLHKLLKVQ